MAKIRLCTEINAPQKVCFLLSTSVDLHKLSTSHTKEDAIEGVKTGNIQLNEFVTWRAKHFGVWLKLTSKITSYNPFEYFVDEMVNGPFKSMKHTHHFEVCGLNIRMTDEFIFESPLGLFGRLVDKFVLYYYLRDLLIKRNKLIKLYAESGAWKKIISINEKNP